MIKKKFAFILLTLLLPVFVFASGTTVYVQPLFTDMSEFGGKSMTHPNIVVDSLAFGHLSQKTYRSRIVFSPLKNDNSKATEPFDGYTYIIALSVLDDELDVLWTGRAFNLAVDFRNKENIEDGMSYTFTKGEWEQQKEGYGLFYLYLSDSQASSLMGNMDNTDYYSVFSFETTTGEVIMCIFSLEDNNTLTMAMDYVNATYPQEL